LNFLGIGPGELIFILMIALIVFGPKRLPEIGRTLGKTVREFRSLSEDLTSQLREELEAASEEVEAVSADVKGTLKAASEEVQAVSEDVKGTLREASAEVRPAWEEAESELVGSKPIESAMEDVAGTVLKAAEQSDQGEPDVGTSQGKSASDQNS